jgi:hypothetical protein
LLERDHLALHQGDAIDSLTGRSVNDVKVNAPFLLEMAQAQP